MTMARRGLKVKVKVMGHANAIGQSSIKGSFFLVEVAMYLLNIKKLHVQLNITLQIFSSGSY